MIVKLYAGENLIYDSRLENYKLLSIRVKAFINKGGSATFVLPPRHPSYNNFVAYKTIIRIYRDGELIFRGRVLSYSDDFELRRTVTCEGERYFLQDAVMRPYLYQADPAVVFADVISQYNAQVGADKQFTLGRVTVVDSNNYIRLEAWNAERVSDTIKKLVDRCGGYIVFNYNAAGQRVINWLGGIDGTKSDQAIEFGTNLLDYTNEVANTDLVTAIFPYGAMDENNKRVTIASVNNGVDYIQDDDAVAIRGFIAKPVMWDDVTIPANLLAKAQQYLEQNKSIISTLTLSAVDLSTIDSSIDRFSVGDTIRVRSKPHGVDRDFKLTERTYDLLNPASDTITLGGTTVSLTDMGASGGSSMTAIQQSSDSLKNYVDSNFTAVEDHAGFDGTGRWNYRKYADGSFDAWCVCAVSMAITTAMGSWFRSDGIIPPDLPFAATIMAAAPAFTPGDKNLSALPWAWSTPAGTKPPRYYLIRHTSEAEVDGQLHLCVHGRWDQGGDTT